MQLRRDSRYLLSLAVLSIGSIVALSSAARAQGFGLNEISTCGVGRAYSAVATGCHDASTIYWNPAASTSLNGWSVLAGAAVIALDGSFRQDTTFKTYDADVPSAVVPHLFVNYHGTGSRLAYGVGVYVPYGLTSQWKQDFPGRFSAQKAALQTLYVQPNVGFMINDRWSIGVGPIIAHSSIELRQSVDLSQQQANATTTFAQLGIAQRTEFARAKLKGGAMGYGAHFGLQGKLNKDWSFGARYLTEVKFKYDDADATFTPVNTGLVLAAGNPLGLPPGTPVDAVVASAFTTGPLQSQKVSTKITHPSQIQAGFAYSGFAGWELEADFAFIDYRSFGSLPIDFANAATPDRTLIEDYNGSSSIRLAVERHFTNNVQLRAGFAGVAAAAPDETVTPLLPEQDRANYALGATLPLFGRWMVDAGYVRVATGGRRGRIDERTSRSQSASQLNTGVFDLSANIFALSLKSSF